MASRSIFVIGGVLTLLGLIMIPLPGPGALIVSLGLLVLVVGFVISAAARLSRQRRKPSIR
jgi:dipeptide/tripeptide permease